MASSQPDTPVLAASPPFSANADSTGSKLDDHNKVSTVQPQSTDSYPASRSSQALSSSCSRSRPSTTSSFTAFKQESEEENLDHDDEEPEAKLHDSRVSDLARAFSVIKASWKNVLPNLPSLDWYTLHILPSQYHELCSQLEDEHPSLLYYFEDRLRFDYDPEQGVMILRSGGKALHEVLQAQIMQELVLQLSPRVKRDADEVFKILLEDIMMAGHAKVILSTRRLDIESARVDARKCPDGQFRFSGKSAHETPSPYDYEGSLTPEVVLEVGQGQKAQDLEVLARDYFDKSEEPRVKTVLTVKIEYVRTEQRKMAKNQGGSESNRTASYCLYRDGHCVHRDIVFCIDGGQQVDGGPIRLPIADFVPDTVLDQLSCPLRNRAETTCIELSHEYLCKSLKQADLAQKLQDSWDQPKPDKSSKVKLKRPRADKR